MWLQVYLYVRTMQFNSVEWVYSTYCTHVCRYMYACTHTFMHIVHICIHDDNTFLLQILRPKASKTFLCMYKHTLLPTASSNTCNTCAVELMQDVRVSDLSHKWYSLVPTSTIHAICIYTCVTNPLMYSVKAVKH